MRAIQKQVPEQAVFDERAVAFDVILLYDDRKHGELGKEIFDRIRARLPYETGTRLNLWRFDALQDPEAERLARLDAMDADLVIVSAGGTEPLTEEVKAALEAWLLGTGTARLGLLVLLANVPERDKDESPVHSYVEGLATRSGCELFSCGLQRERNPVRFRTEDRIEPGLLDQEFMAMSPPGRRWGINE